MKIAVFHNYLDNIGGAEIVGLTLARELGADVYTTNIDSEKIEKMGFEDVLPRVFSIGKVPLNAPFRQQLALTRFRFLNLKNKYDFYIIDGDWAVSGACNNHPNLWYVHSPIREIWDLYQYAKKNIVPIFLWPFFDLWVFYNRYLNKKYADKVDIFVCNSKNTQNRLKKFLGKSSVVVNPPIDTEKFCSKNPPAGGESYWLSVNRLFYHKRVGMQMSAFSKLQKEKLIIVGSYEMSKHFKDYADFCKKTKPKNVEIKSWVSQPELAELYANCKGFLATTNNEDFGMSVVEAMASGKPVIAPNEGGYKETVLNGKTGVLIDNINKDKLTQAVKKLSKEIKDDPKKYRTACQKQAQKFNTKIFVRKIKSLLKNS